MLIKSNLILIIKVENFVKISQPGIQTFKSSKGFLPENSIKLILY